MAAQYWLSNTIQAIQDLILACPTATTMGLTALNVAWQDTRGGLSSPFWIISISGGQESEDAAQRVTSHADTVSVYLLWNPGDGSGNGPAETACNQFGQILSEIAGLVGTSTYLVRASRSWEAPQRLPDHDPNAGKWDAVITFTWEI